MKEYDGCDDYFFGFVEFISKDYVDSDVLVMCVFVDMMWKL